MSAAHHCRMSVSGLQNLMTSEGRNADDLAAFGALNDRITTSGTCFYCCRTLTVVEINSIHRGGETKDNGMVESGSFDDCKESLSTVA